MRHVLMSERHSADDIRVRGFSPRNRPNEEERAA